MLLRWRRRSAFERDSALGRVLGEGDFALATISFVVPSSCYLLGGSHDCEQREGVSLLLSFGCSFARPEARFPFARRTPSHAYEGA